MTSKQRTTAQSKKETEAEEAKEPKPKTPKHAFGTCVPQGECQCQ